MVEEVPLLSQARITGVVPGIGEHSFVLRGSNCQIIRYSADDGRLADTGVALNLSEVPGTPAQLILACGEHYAYLRSPASRSTIYEADMERGKVVQQWTAGVGRQLEFRHVEHSHKGAQASADRTFVALTNTSLHRFDARAPGGVVQTAELQELAGHEYKAVQGLTCCRADRKSVV